MTVNKTQRDSEKFKCLSTKSLKLSNAMIWLPALAPNLNKDTIYYCLIHKSTEIIYRLDSDNISTKRVRKLIIPK